MYNDYECSVHNDVLSVQMMSNLLLQAQNEKSAGRVRIPVAIVEFTLPFGKVRVYLVSPLTAMGGSRQWKYLKSTRNST